MLQADLDGNGAQVVEQQVDHQSKHLTQSGSQRCAVNAHFGERSQTEDQQRIQNNIGQAAQAQTHHGHLHTTDCLENLFKCQVCVDYNGKAKHNAPVAHPQVNHRPVLGKCLQKQRNDGNTHTGEQHPVHQRPQHTLRGCLVRALLLSGTQIQSDHCADPHAKADGNGVDQILQGIHQGQRRHSVLADAGHKVAVYNIIKGVHQHGEHHGQRHRGNQRQHCLFAHKLFVHLFSFLLAGIKKPRTPKSVWRKDEQLRKNPQLNFRPVL